MRNQNEFTQKIFEKLSEMITQTGDFTLTWEELLNELTEGNEDALLRGLQRYVNDLDLSANKFKPLTNPNLFSLEDMVFVDSELESYYICYNDVEIIHLSRDTSARAYEIDHSTNRRVRRFKAFFRNAW